MFVSSLTFIFQFRFSVAINDQHVVDIDDVVGVGGVDDSQNNLTLLSSPLKKCRRWITLNQCSRQINTELFQLYFHTRGLKIK